MSLFLSGTKEELREKFSLLSTKEEIASLLDLDYSLLTYHLYGTSYTARYTTFSLPKKSGGSRQIAAPVTALKIIQRKLNFVLQQRYLPKPSTHGFTYERGILTNARVHCKQRYVLNVDLQDFFPSINFGRVRGMFMSIPYELNAEVATTLAQICCWNNALPQGAPTSPVVSNMICAKMDSELQRLAKDYRCFYTRYADDITFSTSIRNFPQALGRTESSPTGDKLEVGSELVRIIRQNGLEINPSKVRLLQNNRKQQVTGLTTNLIPNVTRKYTHQIRAMLHAWDKFGLDSAEEEFRTKYDKKFRHPTKSLVSFRHVVQGKIEFLGHVRGKEHPIYLRFLSKLQELAPELVKRPIVVSPSPGIMVSVRTEGKTDLKHLMAAYGNFTERGWFAGLQIGFNETEPETGSSDLLNFCIQASKLGYHPNPVICIFDTDEANILKRISDNDKQYKDWGNNVFSFPLPIPDHREDNPEVCIELY